MKRIKLDLHTHSILSKDGGITLKQYQNAFKNGLLDFIAITDHDRIGFAQKARRKIGPQIIIGEEIKTCEGEIIGLYLKEKIPQGLTLFETIKKIKSQNGLVYLPHPFDPQRFSVPKKTATQIIDKIDIVEIFNTRSLLPGIDRPAKNFAREFKLSGAVGSDSHSASELGRTFNIIDSKPDRINLTKLLKNAEFKTRRVSITNIFSPLRNAIRKRISKTQ